MKEESWNFLLEATRKELQMTVSALNVAKDRSELPLFASSSVILSEIKKRAGLSKDKSYRDFITTIGKAVNCPETPWNLYDYFLLSTILIKIIKTVNDMSFNLEVAEILNLSNSMTETLCDELMSRTRSSEQFRKSLPFYMTSLLGIHWEDTITAHPTDFSISGLLTMMETSSLFFTRLSVFTKGGALSVIGEIGRKIFVALEMLFDFLKNDSQDDLYSILPVVPVLILIRQEHNSSIRSPQEAIEYVNDEIRLQKTFINMSHAALSIIIQMADCNREDKKMITKYKQEIDSSLLKKKRLPIPTYRLKKLLPFKKNVFEELWKWVEEEYQHNRLHFELSNDVINALKSDLFKESRTTRDSNRGNYNPTINEINDNNRKDSLTPDSKVVNNGDVLGDPKKTTSLHSHLKDTNSSASEVDRLRAQILELKTQLSEMKDIKEEYERTFRYLRHDLKSIYVASVQPLYIYLSTHTISDEDVLHAIEAEKVVSSIIQNVGLEYGVIDNETYNLSEMVESKMKCESFNFKWSPQNNFKTRISIPKIQFEARVLGNIANNLQMHAFPTKYYDSIPKENKIVEACITEHEDKVVLSISNNGRPISNENINHIFEEGACFGETGHTGLGLSYVKKFMEHWEGTVTASIPHNNYSIQFTFTFKKQNYEKEV